MERGVAYGHIVMEQPIVFVPYELHFIAAVVKQKQLATNSTNDILLV